jgi:glycosyltransferase involved in cell wall biosynthesis
VAALWRPFGVRYLYDHHDVCPELYEAKFGKRGLLHRIMRVFERASFALATVSMATNDSFCRIAVTRGGMPPGDVFVVRSAPKAESFLPGPGDRDWRRGAGTVMGYVGVIGQQEGMDLLVAAAAHLVRALGTADARLADVHFLIVGFGPQLEAVQALVTAHGLDHLFTFTGALYGEDLLGALNAIDIGVAPDPKNAMNDISTMNKIMEYMTLEKPVVLFDLTEGRASAGEAALYATPSDPQDFAAKLAELISDPARREAMGRLGRARVLEHLSWAHSAPQLLAAYDRIFARMGRPPLPPPPGV